MKRALLVSVLFMFSFVLLSGCGDPVEKSKKIYNKGVELLQDGKTDAAEKKFKKAKDVDPKNAKAFFQLGFMHSRNLDEIEIAISYLKSGCAVDPNNELAHFTLALLYGEKGLIEFEISELRKTIKLNNDNEGAHYNLGVIYSRKRLYENAASEFGEVLRINPNEADALLNLANVNLRMGKIDDAVMIKGKLDKLNKENASKLETMIAAAKKALAEREAGDAKKGAAPAKKKALKMKTAPKEETKKDE